MRQPLVVRAARNPRKPRNTLIVPPPRLEGAWATIALETGSISVAMHGGRMEFDVPIAPPV